MNSPSASATWSTQGVVVAGGNGCGNALNQLAAPCYIFIDASDAIYIADANNNRILKWGKGATEGIVVASDQLNGPGYIIVDKQGTMFIRDGMGTYRVTRWPKGAQLGEVIYSSTISPDALAFDENEEYLLISLGAENRVVKYNKTNGEEIEVVAGGNGEGRSVKQLHLPGDIVVDQNGSLYISDYANNRIVKWEKNSTSGTVVLGNDGGDNPIGLKNPAGVAIDPQGAVYTIDSQKQHVVRSVLSQDRKTETIILKKDAQASPENQYDAPVDFAFDSQWNLYIADQLNSRILMFKLNNP